MSLDITKLIEKAEELAYDGKIENAASGEIKVQEITYESGTYEVFIVMRLKENREGTTLKG